MQIVRLYKTTVADRDTNYAIRFITIPAESITKQNQDLLEKNPRALAEVLGLKEFETFETLPSNFLCSSMRLH